MASNSPSRFLYIKLYASQPLYSIKSSSAFPNIIIQSPKRWTTTKTIGVVTFLDALGANNQSVSASIERGLAEEVTAIRD